ncbi:MAG: trypsin-like peptidase domain-containing protein [Planctomycetota bacterium]
MTHAVRMVLSIGLVLTWLGGSALAMPPNDDFANAIALEGASGTVNGTNVRSSREAGEPFHDDAGGGSSVWWKFRPESDGGLSVNTFGSDFDTVLAVYTGSNVRFLRRVASNDDAGADLQSEVFTPVTAGTTYSIAVDGYDGETGNVTLNWSFTGEEICEPEPATGPAPPHEGHSSGLTVRLEWGLAGNNAQKIIYGEDDRMDVYEVDDADLLKAYDSTVVFISRENLQRLDDDTFRLVGPIYGEEQMLCRDEPYWSQPSPGWCSGFLVAPDIVATAGHCVNDSGECRDSVMVFGFRMLDKNTPQIDIPASQVYFCQGIVGRDLSDTGPDWALIKLDREVPDHEPLPIRREGQIRTGQDVVMIGHPAGLPSKITPGAQVRARSAPSYFVATLDAYAGNSGSAVFNADTMVVEGVLSRGEFPEFVERGACYVSRVCAMNACLGEEVTRSTVFAPLVPQSSGTDEYLVRFGNSERLFPQGLTMARSWTVENLEPGTEYHWQIETVNDCGRVLGPVWSFTTPGADRFQRGDARDSGDVNLSDAITILNYLFLSGASPSCLKAADADDSGGLNLTDGVYLLTFLFQGGAAPPPPYGECGGDATEDELSCDVSAFCP